MFGFTLNLDKVALFSIISAVLAICSCFILKTSIEQTINGNEKIPYSRIKGFILLLISISLLIGSLTALLTADKIIKFLMTSKTLLAWLPF